MVTVHYESAPAEEKHTDAHPEWLVMLSFGLVVLLIIFLPGAGKMRSSGGVSIEWYFCAFVALGMLALNLCALKALWHRRWPSRLGLYLSLGIVALVTGLLVDFAQEQKQFDHWAHRSISYDPLD